MKQIITRLNSLFSYDKIFNRVSNIMPDLIISVFIILAFLLLWKILNRMLMRIFNELKINKTLQNFAVNITKNVIFILGILTILAQIGINTTSILASIGVAGLTIGFAARDALSNIISGLFIFWDRPFVIDDLIEINGQYGKVEKINMRSTRLSTVDGKMITIPNTEIINSMVASYTNFPNLRIEVSFTVAVDENLGRVRELLLQLVKADSAFLTNPEPEIVLNSINDYNIELIFRAWIKDEKQHIPLRFNLREKILDTLLKADVNMPYETINIMLDKKAEWPNEDK